jgi:hypothetical protein
MRNYNRRRASLTQPLMMRHDYGADLYSSEFESSDMESEELYGRWTTDETVDPTVNMSPEGKKKWNKYKGKIEEVNEGKMKSASRRIARLKGRYLTASKEGKLADELLGSLDFDMTMDQLLSQADECEEMASVLESALEAQDVDTLDQHGVLPESLAQAVRNGISALYEADRLVRDKITALQAKALECRSKARGMRFASENMADVDGNYMSVQHISEMQDMLGVLSQKIQSGMDMEDWVESKIAHAHQILGDLASYFYYGGHK